MNPTVRATWVLAVVLAGAVLVDVAAHVEPTSSFEELPEIQPIDPGQVSRIELTKGDTLVEIARDESGRWTVQSPFVYPADLPSIDALLAPLAEGVAMDVRIDEGDLEPYGLLSPEALRVDLTGSGGSLTSFYVGYDAAGGTSFVRLADSEVVYRAQLGGRHRFDRPPLQWRDHGVVSIRAAELDVIAIERAGETLTFARAADEPLRWTLAEDPSFPLDPVLVEEVAVGFEKVRALEVLSPEHPSGLESPVVRVTLRQGAFEHVVAFGRTPDGAYARTVGAEEVLRVPEALVDRLELPRDQWRTREIWTLEPSSIARVTLTDAGLSSVLVRGADGDWDIVQPANVPTDPESVRELLAILARARFDGLVSVRPAEAGFPSETQFVVEPGGWTLEIGAAMPGRARGAETLYARRSDQPDRIGVLSAHTVSRLRKAFTR